jgi:hypothetical protein
MTPTPPTDPFRDLPQPVEPETPTVERTSVLAGIPEAPRAAAEQRWQALARLMTVGPGSLAPLVRVAPLPDGVMLTHRLPAGAVSLADLRAAGPLRAGHVVTVALAVADALVALADDGLAHGGVCADQVLVGMDGSVVLGGCGLAWHRAPADVEGPRVADDVAALGELVRDLLGTGSSPSALVLAALRASDPDPALRPSPLELHGLLQRCGRADPLLDLLWAGRATEPLASAAPPPAARLRIDPRTAPDLVDDLPPHDDGAGRAGISPERRAGVPRRPAPRERRRSAGKGVRGPLLLVLVSMLALLALGAVRVGARAMADGPGAVDPPASASPWASGSVSTAPPDGSSEPAPEPSSSGSGADVPVDAAAAGLLLDRAAADGAPDWLALLAAADAGRQRALAAGDAGALEDWVDPDGSAWTADAALAARVTALSAQIDGGDLVVLEVRPRRVTPSQAVLLVQDRREAYSVVTPGGRSDVPARAARWWQVSLARTTDSGGGDGWRIRDVTAVAAPTR